jgi:hypothetical protein
MRFAAVALARHNRLGDGCGMVGAETRLVQDFPHKPGEFRLSKSKWCRSFSHPLQRILFPNGIQDACRVVMPGKRTGACGKRAVSRPE